MTVQEKYTALTTRGQGYVSRRLSNLSEREYFEIGAMFGLKFTRQHTPLHLWSMLKDAIDKFEASKNAENAPAVEPVQEEMPAVEVAPTVDKISKTAEKYFASEMTGDEVEAVMNKAEDKTLREFAKQREIPIDDNEDHAGLVKIVMEELVCEKLGVYDDEPTDGETYAEPEQTAPVIEAVKEETPAPAKVWLANRHSFNFRNPIACVERTDLTAKFAAKMVQIIDEQMNQQKFKDLHNLHGFEWEDRYHATSADWVKANREKYRLELLRKHYEARTYRRKELEELTAEEWSRVSLDDLMWIEAGYGVSSLPDCMPEHEIKRVDAEIVRKREADRPFLEGLARYEKWLQTPEGRKTDEAWTWRGGH